MGDGFPFQKLPETKSAPDDAGSFMQDSHHQAEIAVSLRVMTSCILVLWFLDFEFPGVWQGSTVFQDAFKGRISRNSPLVSR
jgi:hypothetical protein